MAFENCNIHPDILLGLRDLGYEELLDVQQACLEPIRAKRHLFVRSKTGTGKTAAFGIPLLEQLDPQHRGPSVLILAPTRELAGQIASELSAIGAHRQIRVQTAYGGARIETQIAALKKGVHVVVGTPGRLLDLVERKSLVLEQIQTLVLDEADEMLSMGFYEDVTKLMDACEACQQVIILSASLNAQTEGLVERYTSEVVRIDLSVDSLSVEGINHQYYALGEGLPKHHYLLHVLADQEPSSAIVFVNTRSDAALVTTQLAREGIHAEMISGQLPQVERERVMSSIRSGKLQYLVATDLAARGIDISHLSHVINYSLPQDPPVYLHRVGRTGRVGRQGTAVSLVSGARVRTLGVLERQFHIQFEERRFPPEDKIVALRCQTMVTNLQREAEFAICDGFLNQARAVLEHSAAQQLVAYLLKLRADVLHDRNRTKANRPHHKPRSKPKGNRPKRKRSRRS